MFAWVGILLRLLPGFLRSPLEFVKWVFQLPWRLLVKATWRIHKQWKDFWAGFWWATHGLLVLGNRVRLALWRLVKQWIPGKIRKAISDVWKALVKWVTKGWNILKKFISDVFEWAKRGLGKLTNFVNDLLKWVNKWISKIWKLLTDTAKLVGELLTDPEKLVRWAMAAVWSLWWELFEFFAPKVMTLVIRAGIPIVLRMAGFLERVIAKLI